MAISKIDPAGLDVGQIGGRRNLIINGAMQVAQRGTSFSSIGIATYTIDRWMMRRDGAASAAVTVSQSSESPNGFASSLKLDVTTALASLASSDSYRIVQKIEAQDLQALAYGTSAAKTATISFWVRSNKTGTYTFAMYQDDDARLQSLNYTIDSANTWEKKTLTISADTTGVIDNNNGIGIWFIWFVAAGSAYTSGTQPSTWEAYSQSNYVSSSQVNLLDNTANEFYITGVQLEVGSVATPFEHRSYGEELALCQRYFQTHTGIVVNAYSAAAALGTIQPPVSLRAVPTISASAPISLDNPAEANYVQSSTNISIWGNGYANDAPYSAVQSSIAFALGSFSGMEVDDMLYVRNNGGYILVDAEL